MPNNDKKNWHLYSDYLFCFTAHIQTLKKSTCKGDKKKKKEIAEEIGRLEENLEKRQAEELNTWKLARVTLTSEEQTEPVQITEEISQDNYTEQSTHRISKAQKRRERKATAEKERNQRIIEQEVLNVFGKRNVEIEAIKKILSDRDLIIYEIPSDGHWYIDFITFLNRYVAYIFFL